MRYTLLPLIAPVLLATAGCGGEQPQVPEPPVSQVPSGLEYVVAVDPAQPYRLLASVDLGAHPGTDRTAKARGVDFGLAAQVLEPRCDGTALAAVENGQWRLPDDCRVLDWRIDVRRAVGNGLNAADQATLHFADAHWWLLSEPTSLLRLSHIDDAVALSLRIEGVPDGGTLAAATMIDAARWRVPPTGSAPEFYAFGTLTTQTHQIGRLRATYVIDDEARFGQLPLLALHRQALGYFSDLFGVPESLPERDRHLLVVWLGIDEAHGEAGGAAGSRSFLANYVDGDPENIERNAVRTMLVLAHEQVHQLHDLLRTTDGAPLPAWLNESFAHHYALKALARSDLDPGLLGALKAAFVDPGRPVEAGLVEYERRHAAGDPEAYDMFYLQGATFWAEADRLLEAGHPGSGGLDALIRDFLAAEGEGGALPAPLRAALVARGGPEVAALIARYVGD